MKLLPHADILSFDEIVEFATVAVGQGVTKIRLTGGEPLVRLGVIGLVERIARIPGLRDFGMTTNAIALPEFAQPLKDAGLHRLNISLDSVDPDRYRKITRWGDLSVALSGIAAAMAAGFEPIKLNCVVRNSADEMDARGVALFAKEHGLEVRFIRRMNLATGEFWPVNGGEGGTCSSCARLRLSSDGKLYPCLFSDRAYDLRALGAEAALQAAVTGKPASGHRSDRAFSTLGG